MATYDLNIHIEPGHRLNLCIPVPESTPPNHYADMLAAQLAPDQLNAAPKQTHFFTVHMAEQAIEIAIEADSQEVAAKIVCARCYNIIKTEAVRNT